jgi:hypothetical protein
MKITGQGLLSIGLLTGVLWGCIFAEQFTVTLARANASHALQEIRALQIRKTAPPVSAPVLKRPANRPISG